MVYLPPAFTEKRPEVLLEHIERYDFGLLVTHGAEGLVASHIPFLIERDGERLHLHGHLARPNPQVGDLARGGEVLAIFHGPHAYISVQLIEDTEWLRRFLVRLSERHETGNPVAWRMQDLPESYVETMLKGIIGLDILVTRLEGKHKLSQNRPAADRRGVIAALEAQTDPESHAVARLMRDREPV